MSNPVAVPSRAVLVLTALAISSGTAISAQVAPATSPASRDFAWEIVEAVVESATGLPTRLVLPDAHVAWHADGVVLDGSEEPPTSLRAAVEMIVAEGRVDPADEFRILRRYAEEFRGGREVFGVTVHTHCLVDRDPLLLSTLDFDITYEVEYSGGDAVLYRMRVAAVEGPEGLYLGSRRGGASLEIVTARGC